MLALLGSLPRKPARTRKNPAILFTRIAKSVHFNHKKNPAFDLARVAFPSQKNPEIVLARVAWMVRDFDPNNSPPKSGDTQIEHYFQV